MKFVALLLVVLLYSSCTEKNETMQSADPLTKEEKSVQLLYTKLHSGELYYNKPGSMKKVLTPKFSKVNLIVELGDLFNPDKFICNIDEKVKNKIKGIKVNGVQTGFIPQVILNNAIYSDSVISLDLLGVTMAAHLIEYKQSSEIDYKVTYVGGSPTFNSFNMDDYFLRTGKVSYFSYSVDCSGFLAASASIWAGVGSNNIKTSAENSISSRTELFLQGGLMELPIALAYSGIGKFSTDTLPVLRERLLILESVLNTLPDNYKKENSVEIKLNSNQLVIIASNNGESNSNGKIELNASVGGSLGIVSGKGDFEGKIAFNKKSEYTNYKTYIAAYNFLKEPIIITCQELKSKIKEVEKKLSGKR